MLSSNIKVLHVNLGTEEPLFSILAELELDNFSSGLNNQLNTVTASLFHRGQDSMEAFSWDWRSGDTVEIVSPEPGNSVSGSTYYQAF